MSFSPQDCLFYICANLFAGADVDGQREMAEQNVNHGEQDSVR